MLHVHIKFQASEPSGSDKKYFSMFYMVQTQDPPGVGPFCSLGPSFEYLLCVVVVLLFYVHGKHLRSCREDQLT